MALLMAKQMGGVAHVGLHHCGPAPGTKQSPSSHGAGDVIRVLRFASELVVRVREMGFAFLKSLWIHCSTYCCCSLLSLTDFDLPQGCDELARQLPSADLPALRCLKLLELPHLLPDNVAAILDLASSPARTTTASDPSLLTSCSTNGEAIADSGGGRPWLPGLCRLEVRACRHVPPHLGPALQQRAAGGWAEARREVQERRRRAGGGERDEDVLADPGQRGATHVVVDSWSPA